MTETTKPTLLLLSDLWGDLYPDWSIHYLEKLKDNFEVKVLDACKLAGVNQEIENGDYLHQQFINGGIDRAVNRLISENKQAVYAIGLSIGGTILWKSALSGLKIKMLIAVSATRLRYEVSKPLANIQLFYGRDDHHQPTPEWFRQMQLTPKIIMEQGHLIYREKQIIDEVCDLLVAKKYH